MADLPKERIQASRAFIVTGVDYCGPFYFKPETRNKSPQKCYISVFICFATKAVWMELVRDLSTGAFLEALKRFTATRGMPSCIWSDNATNFVGAKNELRDLKRLLLSEEHRSKVHVHCLNNGFDWRFIPPRSPHFGGLWEAAVKMAKQHLYRTLGSAILSFDELRTLIQGQIYHLHGSVVPTPDEPHQFLEIYFISSMVDQLNVRCNIQGAQQLKRRIIEQWQAFFHANNAVVNMFKTALEHNIMSDCKKRRLESSKNPEVCEKWLSELSSSEESAMDEKNATGVDEDTDINVNAAEESDHETESD
ncbi:uncharacterized protein LOC129250750 [Anastrepha obliqua]|uniref:uncharacterized protein LOC129250750 n=1 Tax=Anastrepha obliqua TaxID=95512 RepID=UPI002409A6DA|nr:uncharacterized protein LOC129250750 [Anastrepha obliqua]